VNYFISENRDKGVLNDETIEMWRKNVSREMLTSLSYAFPSALIKRKIEELNNKQPNPIFNSILTLFQ